MPTKDISRYLFQPEKRYSGVRMQQGRVILDSDWNESERIDQEEMRRLALDMIGTRGTRDDGFKVGIVDTVPDPLPIADAYDFPVAAGSYYLGGTRYEASAETFLTQGDWLTQDLDTGTLPTKPAAAELPPTLDQVFRHDLVYLEAWEQPVCAVEDRELLERALGGPDTSVRMRRMHRVKVEPDVAITTPTCDDAFGQLPLNGTFDSDTHELLSDARLELGFLAGASSDLCSPGDSGGFLGAENEALRIQLVDSTHLVWGRDNASPLYRVSVDEASLKISFVTPPRDQASQPLKDQLVEVLAPGAKLPNGEYLAESTGVLLQVATSYDPETASLTFSAVSAELSALLAWRTAHTEIPSLAEDGSFFLRVWTGGPALDFSGGPVTLPGTGLQVTIAGAGNPGDHWIAALRPETPNQIVPWELQQVGGA
ncbi:MAG: DUF6519 domain-containing protein, partial [Myxococcales bacterium]|nr:DUF6519 domain-containing protein [Myxococcales bacterium]